MKLTEIREILDLITSFDRRPFPEGADVAWLELLAGVQYEDARRGVMRYYANPDADGPISAGELRRAAHWFADRRKRADRALPAAPKQTEKAEDARAAIREATSKAVASYRERHPDARKYRHRAELALIIRNARADTP